MLAVYREAMADLKRMSLRQLATQTMNVLLLIATALAAWKLALAWSGSPSPIVVVLSGSMEPAYQRGDLLVL